MTWRLQHDVGRVIVQAVDPPPGYPPGVTRQQFKACAAVAMPTDAYLYLWTNSDVRTDMLAKLALLNGLEQYVGRLFLDVEDTAAARVDQRIQSVRRALDVLDAWSRVHGKPLTAIYAARWHWSAYMGNTVEFGERELWTAQYDNIEDPDVFNPFGGFTRCEIKQYRGTSTLAGVTGVDLNIVRNSQ